jgi:hypothetical protein
MSMDGINARRSKSASSTDWLSIVGNACPRTPILYVDMALMPSTHIKSWTSSRNGQNKHQRPGVG